MTKINLLLLSLTAASLAACGPTREEQAAQAEADADAEAMSEDIELPPAITDEGTYRCKDNTIIYVDFYGEAQGASIRVGDKTAVPIRVSPAKAAEGEEEEAPTGVAVSEDGEASLEGTGDQITVKLPGKAAQSCKS